MEFHFHFYFSFFVYLWHWKTDLNFVCRVSFSHHFEKRIWISFFVFRFRITLKNGFEFRFSYFVYRLTLKNGFAFRFSFFVLASALKNGFEFRFSLFVSVHVASPSFAPEGLETSYISVLAGIPNSNGGVRRCSRRGFCPLFSYSTETIMTSYNYIYGA